MAATSGDVHTCVCRVLLRDGYVKKTKQIATPTMTVAQGDQQHDAFPNVCVREAVRVMCATFRLADW